jgi:GAF domain-containing protein
MARYDLDAALQLLAGRAQYITGASGAAIALRRNGKNDMQCRASTGSNAPELGALLSTEFGLSGESVRTRQPLRCDDAERDARVNREVCRQLGIASVVVIPVVNDEGVLGVFELFSGEVNAFGERDLSAVQRLSEMVETAVRLAEATENLPERLRTSEMSALAMAKAGAEEDTILEGGVLETLAREELVPENQAAEELVLEEVVRAEPKPLEVAVEPLAGKQMLAVSGVEAPAENGEGRAQEPLEAKIPTPSTGSWTGSGQVLLQKAREDGAPVMSGTVAAAPEAPPAVVPGNVAAAPQAASPPAEPVLVPSTETAPSKNQLYWSAALHPAADGGAPAEADPSYVPPVLRNRRTCEACGFPVSAGRVFCVECEEKKWRGQLKIPVGGSRQQVAMPAPAAPVPQAQAQGVAAAASASAPLTRRVLAAPAVSPTPPAVVERKESKPAEQGAVIEGPAGNSHGRGTASKTSAETSKVSSPEFILTSALEPSPSWLSANKYVLGAVLVIGLVVVAVFVLR